MAFGAPSLKGRALRYLSQREHSRAELARKLWRHSASSAAASGGVGTAAGNSFKGAKSGKSAKNVKSGRYLDCRSAAELAEDAGAAELAESAESGNGAEAGVASEAEDAGVSAIATLNAKIEATLDDLAAHGLLSDERAAASVLHAQAARSGERRLKQVLQAKGLSPELIANTLAQAKGSEFERALALWQRRFGSAALDAPERARQMRFLQGRGFSFDVVARVLRAAGTPPDEAAD